METTKSQSVIKTLSGPFLLESNCVTKFDWWDEIFSIMEMFKVLLVWFTNSNFFRFTKHGVSHYIQPPPDSSKLSNALNLTTTFLMANIQTRINIVRGCEDQRNTIKQPRCVRNTNMLVSKIYKLCTSLWNDDVNCMPQSSWTSRLQFIQFFPSA